MDSASAEYMDCHASTTALARNDDKNGVSKKADSRDNALNASESAKDSRGGDLLLRDTAKDSALGNHCTDFTNFLKKHRLAASGIPCFERTADHQSSSLSKFVKNSTSNTAIPRILEKHKQTECEKSCREQTELESTFQQNAQKSKKVDSRSEAQNLKTPAKDSRISKETSANAERYPLFSKETCFTSFAPLRLFCDEKSGLFKDSQGRALGVRNRPEQPEITDLSRKAQSSSQAPKPTPKQKVDSRDNAQNASESAKDSRNFAHNAPILNDSQAAGFCVFYPNAASKKVDSRSEAQNLKTPAKDSRICDEKSGLFKDSQGRALGVRNRRESAEITDLSRKAESTSKTNLLLDFSFNGWGLKYPSNFDNQITKSLHNLGALGSSPLESSSFILDGRQYRH